MVRTAVVGIGLCRFPSVKRLEQHNLSKKKHPERHGYGHKLHRCDQICHRKHARPEMGSFNISGVKKQDD